MSKQALAEISTALCWKRRLAKAWGVLPAPTSRRVILIYHSVGGGSVSTTVERFNEQMAWLAEYAEVVTLDALLDMQDGKAGKPRVALSFDDGYRTLHDVVAPVLKQHGFPAIVYLNAGEIGAVNRAPSVPAQGHYPDETFMLWGEVAALKEQGWEIGSHGVQHIDLSLSEAHEIRHQLTDSKAIIEDRLGVPCRHFSYTWGHYNPVVRALVAEAGYQTAVAGHHEALSRKSDLFALPRLDIRREYELADFAAVVSGKWDYLGYYQKLRAMIR